MDIKKEILKAIEYVVDSKLRRASFDKTYTGVIVGVNGDGTYGVQINGVIYNNIRSVAEAISINDTVRVVYPQNNPNNMYILNNNANYGGGAIVVDSALSLTSTNTVQNKVVTVALNDCFQSVSNGKELIASAITDKGVATDATDTFLEMSDNIREINGEMYSITITTVDTIKNTILNTFYTDYSS